MTISTALLPNLDGELEAVLLILDEVLIALHRVIDDERAADPTWEPPAGLDQLDTFHQPGETNDSFARIWRAVRDAGERSGKVYAPDGQYEHLPLRVIQLESADVERFAATVSTLGALVEANDTILTEIIDERAGGRSPADMIDAWARAHLLADLPGNDFTAALVAELGDGTVDVTLTPAGEASYQSTADRLVRLYHDRSALDRYLY